MTDSPASAQSNPTASLAYALGEPSLRARFKQRDDDFRVVERLSFEPDGFGEHLLMRVRKQGLNTMAVVEHLARWARVKPHAIGYAGLKDKRAVTEQAFTVPMPIKAEFDVASIDTDRIQLLDYSRSERKLRHGAIRSNSFRIVLRDCLPADQALWSGRLAAIAASGVPNYFAEQRFGRDGDNLRQAAEWMRGERRVRGGAKRGMLLSAVRSQVFNERLSAAVAGGSWCAWPGSGARLQIDGSHSLFEVGDKDPETLTRLERGEVHRVFALPGADDAPDGWVDPWLPLLRDQRADQAWRAARLMPRHLDWSWLDDSSLCLQFELPSGCYATAVLRELATLDAQRHYTSDD